MNLAAVGRRNLVIVRAGPNSLHLGWLGEGYSGRDFDLVVSYYDTDAYARHPREEGVTAFLQSGGKWDGIAATLDWLGGALDAYDYIWLPDDDIEATSETINGIFAAMRCHGLAIAQPALTPDSYFTHFLFIRCPGLALRYTNYIEIMVPCLSRALLAAVRPHFRATMSGFGLDYIWCRLPEAKPGWAAILDSITVRHTRPVGRVLLGHMARRGRSPKDEEAELAASFGITERVTPLVHGAVTANGRHMRGSLGDIGLELAIRHTAFLIAHPWSKRQFGFGRIVQLMRRQLTRHSDLAPLPSAAVNDRRNSERTAFASTTKRR